MKNKFCFAFMHIFHEYKISNSQFSLYNNKHTHVDVRIVIKSEADILLYWPTYQQTKKHFNFHCCSIMILILKIL